MLKVRQLAAMALALLFLGTPLVALGDCFAGSSASSHCPPDCPMMRDQSGGMKLQAAPSGDGSCCEVRAAQKQAETPLQVPTSKQVVGIPQSSLPAGSLIQPATAAEPALTAEATATQSPQALLCTFLI